MRTKQTPKIKEGRERFLAWVNTQKKNRRDEAPYIRALNKMVFAYQEAKKDLAKKEGELNLAKSKLDTEKDEKEREKLEEAIVSLVFEAGKLSDLVNRKSSAIKSFFSELSVSQKKKARKWANAPSTL